MNENVASEPTALSVWVDRQQPDQANMLPLYPNHVARKNKFEPKLCRNKKNAKLNCQLTGPDLSRAMVDLIVAAEFRFLWPKVGGGLALLGLWRDLADKSCLVIWAEGKNEMKMKMCRRSWVGRSVGWSGLVCVSVVESSQRGSFV